LTADRAQMQLSVNGMAMQAINGKVKIRDFQWPDMFGVGLSYTPNAQWQWVADYRRIGWASVMREFRMTFESAAGNLDMSMNQGWRDQHVLMVGAAYKPDRQLTLRGGVNVANNPVPSAMTNPLFPAIVRNHLTAGVGYAFASGNSLDFSLTWAPKSSVHSDYSQSQISHGQANAQVLYAIYF